MSIDAFAGFLRSLLNIAPENRSPSRRDQRREGVNRGGLYYLFEVLGLDLILMTNDGEVAIPERYDYALYPVVQRGDERTNRAVADRIYELVQAEVFGPAWTVSVPEHSWHDRYDGTSYPTLAGLVGELGVKSAPSCCE